MSCWLFHKWIKKWEKVDTYQLKEPFKKTEEMRVVAIYDLFERKCDRCGIVEYEKVYR